MDSVEKTAGLLCYIDQVVSLLLQQGVCYIPQIER